MQHDGNVSARSSPANRVLDGSPYSLSSDAAARQLPRLDAAVDFVKGGVEAATANAAAHGLIAEVQRDQRYREVYESNQLEFEGPDLKATIRAIESADAKQPDDVLRTVVLPRLLAENRDLHAVIGLESARLLGHRMLGQQRQRPLTESDIRSLHERVTAGQPFAGRYRQDDVTIAHSSHRPPREIDVPLHMRELVSWNATCPKTNPILRAAALHAWLTHVHPFDDGNGRVARLLANLVLAEAGLPPAIVKAKTQRNAYLDALETSDEGGDIMPLAGLFTKTLRKYAIDMQKPSFVRRLFRDLVENRGSRIYDWFSNELDLFLRLLTAELTTHRLTAVRWDALDVEAFENYRESRDYSQTTMLMISDNENVRLAINVGAPSRASTRYTAKDEILPSLRLAVRADQYELESYPNVRLRDDDPLGDDLREITFDLGSPRPVRLLVRNRLVRGPSTQMAEFVASYIAKAYEVGTVRRPHQLRLPLPTIHGGPG